MSSRKNKWIITENKDGFSISRGGRTLYSGLGSRQEALRRLKNHHKAGDPVHMEAEDGYRSNITEQLRRSGIIS